MIKYLHSLAGRLTLWYAGVFILCFGVVFGAFYITMYNHFHYWTDRQLKEEVLESSIAYTQDGRVGVVKLLQMEATTEGDRFMGRLVDSEGGIVFQVAPGSWEQVGVNKELLLQARSGQEGVELVQFPDSQEVNVIYRGLPDGSVIQIGLALLPHEIWLKEFASDLAKVAFLTLLLSIGAGGFMARRTLAPIRIMARTASAISGRSLGQRVPISRRGDEVDQLAEAFNGMLERIDRLLRGLRDVTGTLAHDLRNPITGIRGIAEVALRFPRDADGYRMVLHQVIDQMDRLLTQFNSILDVAEAEAQALALRCDAVSINEVANDVLMTFGPVATDKGILLASTVSPGLSVMGDQARIAQVLANLIDNALKYTPSGGQVHVAVESDSSEGGIFLLVSDTGIGISPKDLPHIFERYYRGDCCRSDPGTGLGLPLVRGIAKAHGGRVSVESRPGHGSVFRVFLPFNPKP
jgi:signal transduction histidine kinase